MNRRGFLAALGGAALAGPIAAVAQQPAGVPPIGVLTGADPSIEAAKLDAFRGALERLGYIDGQNVIVEVRYAMGQPEPRTPAETAASRRRKANSSRAIDGIRPKN